MLANVYSSPVFPRMCVFSHLRSRPRSRPSELCLFHIGACGAGNLTCKLGTFLNRKQHRLRVQARPGGSVLSVHEEMAIMADGFPYITDVCRLVWQAQREDRRLRVQVLNTRLCGDGQANLPPGRWTGGEHVGPTSKQDGIHQGVKGTRTSEGFLL